MCRYLLLLLAALVCVSECAPRQRQRPVANSWVKPLPEGPELLLDAQVGQLLRYAPSGARFFRSQPEIPALINRLVDNATLILPDIVDGFKCDDRIYGYYADQLNNCQIFHVCVPMMDLYPGNFTEPITYHFSFICPKYTIFSQDSLVCAWETDAVPCEHAEELYDININFGKIVEREDGNGNRYAYVNEDPQKPAVIILDPSDLPVPIVTQP